MSFYFYSFITCLFSVALLCSSQSTTITCSKSWCGEKWKSEDRIKVYNYTEELENVTFERNITYTKKNCNVTDLLISPNTDLCKTINETKKETITFQVSNYVRSTEPEIRELPRELTLGILASENIDIFGNQSKDNYDELEDKVWQIWVPRNCRLVLFFSEFDLESSPNCSKDYFSVQSTKKQKNIPKYCGGLSSVPKEIQISKRRAQFHFHSDASNVRKGIHATFCFQKAKNVQPDDIPCSCNTDTSGIRKRKAKKHDKSRSSSRSNSRSRSHSRSESRSISHQKRRKISKKEMHELMRQQDKMAGQGLRDMMKNGLKAINRYRYSRTRSMRVLAENYQSALNMLLV